MKRFNVFLAVFLFFQFGLTGCATLKEMSKDPEVQVSTGGAILGGIGGYTGSPKNLDKGYNSVLWAGLVGFITWLIYRAFSKNSAAKKSKRMKAERDLYKEKVEAIKYVSQSRGYIEELDEKGKKKKVTVCIYSINLWAPSDLPSVSFLQTQKAVKIHNPNIECPKTPEALDEAIKKYNQ